MMRLVPRLGYLVLALLLCLPASLLAQPDAKPGLLWRVTGKNLPAPSYLFGTIHLICDPRAVQDDAVGTALASSQQLIVELDLTDPRVTMQAMQLATMPGNQRLDQLLSPDSFALASRYLVDTLGVSLGGLARIKPLLLSAVLYAKVLPCQPVSVDMDLMEQAQDRNMPIIPLETPEDQINMFDRMSLTQQAHLLVRSIVNYQDSRTQFQDLLNAYLARDLSRLQAAVERNAEQEPDLMRALGPERNRAWLPKLKRLFRDKPSFVAVGAAHLLGNEGLIDLLRCAGYRVESVPPTAVAVVPQAPPPGFHRD